MLLILLYLSMTSCNEESIIYKKAYTENEKLKLSESLLNNAGTGRYYQGSVGERMIIHEGNFYNPGNADGQRELGVPYLKRGFASEANQYYTKAANTDPDEWLGYKAYCWLYFYRDYETVLKEVDKFDALTPDFVDYPQSTSVNYMRGICQLRLGSYKEAIKFLSMHIDKEIEDVGEKYVIAAHYLHLGIAYHKAKHYAQADKIFNAALINNENTAELHYYKAINLLSMKKKKEALASLNLAQEWYSKVGPLTRPYVEEFYAIYPEDITRLKEIF